MIAGNEDTATQESQQDLGEQDNAMKTDQLLTGGEHILTQRNNINSNILIQSTEAPTTTMNNDQD